MKAITKSILFFSLTAIAFMSCKKDKNEVPAPQNPNENEVITTMKLIMTDASNSGNVSTATFKDPDGDGGQGVTLFDTIRLNSNKTYNVLILLWDETKTPTDTISNDVKEEGDQHQFFYSVSGGADVTFAYTDVDQNSVPIGLKPIFTTGNATTDNNGKIKVTLKHQGTDKPKSGSGDINIGSTDIEVNFPILIQ